MTKTKFARANIYVGRWKHRCPVPYRDALVIANELLPELLGIGRGYAVSLTETSVDAAFTITKSGEEMCRILLSDGWVNVYIRSFVDLEGVGTIQKPTQKDIELGRGGASLALKLEAALAEAGKSTERRRPAFLPNPAMQKAILRAYEKVSNRGALRAPWDKLRDELRDALDNEPPSKPMLRKMVYAMWKDQAARAEIERLGLADVVHKFPTSK